MGGLYYTADPTDPRQEDMDMLQGTLHFLAGMVAIDALLSTDAEHRSSWNLASSAVYFDIRLYQYSGTNCMYTKCKHMRPSRMLDPDHDLVQAVMSISKKHRIRLNIIFHVKSHQDDDVVAYGQLSCLGSNKAKRQL
jgi:hypothetical protein